MTTAFSALLVAVAGAALLLALGTYLWINRNPSKNERFDDFGRVPLFGVEMSDAAWAEAAARQLRHSDAVTWDDGDDGVAEAVTTAHEVNEADSAVETEPTAQPDDAQGGRSGWGSEPGWPVSAHPPFATPRYTAPATPPPPVPGVRPSAFFPPPPSNSRATNGNGLRREPWQGSMVEGHSVRFSTPAQGTLQFLPGRLEISAGLDTGREIRFVRVPGPNGIEVTFGRNEGPLYRHVQLRDQTVSREHARMTLADGNWQLTNLSTTNPVAHNGRVMGLGEQQPLQDGDKLEMGEVVFSFRSR